jgi:hypothetical protein
VDSLPGFEDDNSWHTGAGGALTYTSRNKVCRIALRYGYGFNANRNGDEGAHSVGLLFQYDFEKWLSGSVERSVKAEGEPVAAAPRRKR